MHTSSPQHKTVGYRFCATSLLLNTFERQLKPYNAYIFGTRSTPSDAGAEFLRFLKADVLFSELIKH